MRRNRHPSALFAFLAVVMLWAPLVAACGVTRISRSEEIRLGQRAAEEVEAQYRTREDPTVTRIGMAVARASRAPELPYRFRVVQEQQVNAFALPGGPVYVTEGLLRMVGDDQDQLAGVLGHEVAHITERHAVRQLERQNLMGTAIAVLTEGRTQDVARILAGLETLSYSRSQERDADWKGAQYARAAGYDPMGLVRFLEQLAKMERGGATIPMLRTHPGSQARADLLRRRLAEQTARR